MKTAKPEAVKRIREELRAAFDKQYNVRALKRMADEEARRLRR